MMKLVTLFALAMFGMGCSAGSGTCTCNKGRLSGRVELESNREKSLISRDEAKGFLENLGFKVLPEDFEGEPDYVVSLDGTYFPPSKDRNQAFHTYDLEVWDWSDDRQMDFGIMMNGEPSAEGKARALSFLKSTVLAGLADLSRPGK